ncbi:MAG: bifunctional 4-hydroxy-2-oxoglutarate aldolase/2-dehydro-3-deoxy-phosphogluconate aldolase [Cyclobacteriaceae bacterium]|nr:bifunctional 4-hydroxy-2-oxoglutarate aldolase/2-dehydro-3-deoxy-phosphogluconate aldolase [Cyclobacteriaceae bacterium]
MQQTEILNHLIESGIVVILRLADSHKVVPLARAILKGGIRTIEVTMNTPHALDRIADLAQIDGILPGAGTVTDAHMAKDAIEAGAQFVVTPISKKEVIETCHNHQKPIISGAFSPAEVYQAHSWGADIIKVFPAEVLGTAYIKALMGPFPFIRLMPAGGVNPDNVGKWYDMGAVCVGVGGSFTNSEILKNEEWDRISGTAHHFAVNIAAYREGKKVR